MTQSFKDKQRLRSRHLAEEEVKVPMEYMIDRLKKLMFKHSGKV